MQLEKKYCNIDDELEKKKKELAAKIAPFILEFVQDTAIPIKGIYPDYIEITTMEKETKQFIIGIIKIET